jgi:diaminopimelate epimerase
MKIVPFFKLQTQGNDFVLLEIAASELPDPGKLAKDMLLPHYAIGGDGLIFLWKEKSRTSNYQFRFYNPDGSEAEICGNALLAVGHFLSRIRHLQGEIALNTKIGVRTIWVQEKPTAKLAPYSSDFKPIEIGEAQSYFTQATGNPHVVILGKLPPESVLRAKGATFERLSIFPKHANINFVHIPNRGEFVLRTWERAAGFTLACASGAAASFLVARNLNLVDQEVWVRFRGGEANISLADSWIIISATSQLVFRSEWDLQQ